MAILVHPPIWTILKEAASTSIVSRNWRKLWTRYPNLCFDGRNDGPADMDSVKIERVKFIETVNSIIQQHSGIGLNKFSIRWVRFATAPKAKIIDMNLCTERNNKGPTKQVYDFPLEAFGAQDIPFIQCLFLTNVSIKPHLDMCGFKKLRSLHFHCVQIIGDPSGLLFNCSSLEDFEVFACSVGNPEFSPNMVVEDNNKVLGHVFHGIPSVSAVKVLNVLVDIYTKQSIWSSQVHTLSARPTTMFMNLKHLTYEILIFTKEPNSHSGILQLAQYLAFAPRMETLELHMLYHHLKTVYTSGFRCYRAQIELLCAILEMGDELEHVTIEPMARVQYSPDLINLGISEDKICQWANCASQRGDGGNGDGVASSGLRAKCPEQPA
uniref:At1g61320/AtMIF1 LRR domain-containing protein n=1 Tax=Oryza punctata TaxID=4537 RepID=A0A0E0LFL7_ORYPU